MTISPTLTLNSFDATDTIFGQLPLGQDGVTRRVASDSTVGELGVLSVNVKSSASNAKRSFALDTVTVSFSKTMDMGLVNGVPIGLVTIPVTLTFVVPRISGNQAMIEGWAVQGLGYLLQYLDGAAISDADAAARKCTVSVNAFGDILIGQR
jgi:hypothetical protein